MNATEACIALNMLPTVGPVRLRKLLEVFREPQQILAAKRGDLRKVDGIGNEVADQISNWESTIDLPAELQRIRDFGATVSRSNRHRILGRSARSMRRRLCSTSGANSWTAIITPSALSSLGEQPITARNRPRSSPTNLLTRD